MTASSCPAGVTAVKGLLYYGPCNHTELMKNGVEQEIGTCSCFKLEAKHAVKSIRSTPERDRFLPSLGNTWANSEKPVV